LIVEDKISMRHSLEVRVPFLDEDLTNFASQLPGALKYDFKHSRFKKEDMTTEKLNSRNDGKIVLRDIAKTMIPSSADLRKQGFSAPDATWFRNDKEKIIQKRLLNPDNGIWRYLTYDVGKTLINDHLEGRSNKRLLVWSLLTLESTIRQFEL
jgi:asparagine synthase (glutamine-hydrolysing)